jgi:hypothetical protein
MPAYGAPRRPTLTEIANDRISFHQALAWAGIHTGMRERGMKVDCPVCGGDNSLRVWPDHGWCFSCRKYLSAVTLLAQKWDMRNPDAAFLALDKIGYVPPGYEELWEEARRGPEPARETLGEALRIWCEANCPGWSARQFEPALAVPLSRCLGLLPSVRTEEECDEWLRRCKRVMGKALELALAK